MSLDIKDAFFSVPPHPTSKQFAIFENKKVRYQYNVLPFWLSSSPRVFTKILKAAISFLRSKGIKISAYLDDIFICANSLE